MRFYRFVILVVATRDAHRGRFQCKKYKIFSLGSRSVVSNLWVANPLGVALIVSGVAVTRHMLAVSVQIRCA